MKLLAYLRALLTPRCRHPFDDSSLIAKVLPRDAPAVDPDFVYTVNVRQCGRCGEHFIDEGLEYKVDPR